MFYLPYRVRFFIYPVIPFTRQAPAILSHRRSAGASAGRPGDEKQSAARLTKGAGGYIFLKKIQKTIFYKTSRISGAGGSYEK